MLCIIFLFHPFLHPIKRAGSGVLALEFILGTIQVVADFLIAVGVFLIFTPRSLRSYRLFHWWEQSVPPMGTDSSLRRNC